MMILAVVVAAADAAEGGSAHWWDVLAGLSPIADLIAAGLAAWIALRTLKQRSRADDRSAWWQRTQWALDRAVDGVGEATILGLDSLRVLAKSNAVDDMDKRLLDAAWNSVLPVSELSADTIGEGPEPEHGLDEGR
ncbi:hypothetical protein JTF08_16425 [Micrococcaceae bacterium RIT802]|nr:hypothetical protein [Micrococcaceae bacterium RIT 802]